VGDETVAADGDAVGFEVGLTLGVDVGFEEGFAEGAVVAAVADGDAVGESEGADVGFVVGFVDGDWLLAASSPVKKLTKSHWKLAAPGSASEVNTASGVATVTRDSW
jgi:hypothetical protein